ncbi:MAG: hypothetical protein M9898_12885 [Chitinophagaceae bacterium]|nr:hypothetical protein [Chitinophagaceae bacterium]
MKIRQYIQNVVDEIKHSSVEDFNIKAFNDFKYFDFINFHLLNKHIFENGKEDLFIAIPEFDYRVHSLESIFYAVVLVKLFQNYCAYTNTNPELFTKDIIFTRGKIYKYLGVTGNYMNLAPKFPAKNQKNAVIQVPKGVYTKLNQEFDYQKRKTVQCLKGFSKFLNSSFKISNFPLLTQFTNKTLIISDKKLTKVNEYIPFRYHTKTGTDIYKLPFDSVIEICNSYTVAESLIESGKINQHFDEIIIIGDAKYRDELFPNIQNGKWNGYFNSIVLIGTNKPTIQHVFKQWNWTKREIIIAHNHEPNEVMGLPVEDEELNAIILELDSFLQDCKVRYSLDIQYLLKFTNYFLRQIIGGVETVNVNFDFYLARVRSHLSSHEFEGIVFSAPKINYSNQTKDEIINAAYSFFERMAALLLLRNKKWQKIVQLASEGKQFSLLIDGKDYETVLHQIKKADISSIKLITTKHSSQLTFDKWLDDAGRYLYETHLVIPYLNNISLYNKLLEIRGKVHVMGYDKLDAHILTNIKAKEDNELTKHINHPDRSLFIKSKLKVDIEEIEEPPFYQNIFELSETTGVSKRYTRDGDPSCEDVFYEVTFDNGFTDVLQGSKRVIWMDVDSSTDLTIQECFVGAAIKYYKNESRELFNELLRIKDSGNVLGHIDEFAKLWRIALGKLQQQYPNLERLYKEIFQGKSPIQFQAFKSYFSPDSKTVFPQSEVLEAIYRMFKRNGYSDNEFTNNYQAIKTAASQHISIKVKFGRQLSKLLSEGDDIELKELLSEIDELPVELKERVSAFVKSGTIKIIKPISNRDERIHAKSTADI